MSLGENLVSMKKGWLILIFVILWGLLRAPVLIHPDGPLNADVAFNLLMSTHWKDEGWIKFMWGSHYIGTIETLWNALWFFILPIRQPFVMIPNYLLALGCDLLFLKLASRWLPLRTLIVLGIFLIFLPSLFLEAQLMPAFSYTTLAIFVFLALLTSHGFLQGILLGLAFYIQPLSMYFIVPFFGYYLLSRSRRHLLFLFIGFLIPFLFAVLPVAGPTMDLKIMVAAGDVADTRQIWRAVKYISLIFLAFLGYPISRDTLQSCDTILLVFSIPLMVGFFGLLIKKRKDFQVNLFITVMVISLILVPLCFLMRKYSVIDMGTRRYLWLWHFPVYFFMGCLFEKMRVRGVLVVYLMVFLSVVLWDRRMIRTGDKPDIVFEKVVAYLQEEDIEGVVGDYWAVYPVAFLTDRSERPIKAVPLRGIVRKPEWRISVGLMPRVAYLCLTEAVNCDKTPPQTFKVGLNRFVIDSSEERRDFLGTNQGNMVVQIYKQDISL